MQSHYKAKTLSRNHRRSGRCSAQYGRMLFMRAASQKVGTSSSENRNRKKNHSDEGSAAGKQEANCSTAAVNSLSCTRFQREMNPTLGTPLALLLIVCACRGERFDTIRNVGSAGETIICFGDSLTEGVGAEPGEEYPTILSRLLGMRVLNAGHRGDTTARALQQELDV